MADWASETADLIERTVTNVRERTVDPAYRITRAVVFGLLAVFFIVPAMLIVFIVSFRGLVNLYNQLPGPDDNAWMAWMTLGGICLLAGAFAWNKRKARA
jgi:hypothetical protein